MVAKGRKATTKVAGHRNSKKPYLRASRSPCGSELPKQKAARKPAPSKAAKRPEAITVNEQLEKRGRPLGRVNFTDEDKQELLRVVRNALPLGGNSWKTVGDMFNEWAKHNRRPERPFKSLEVKFKAVCISCLFFNTVLANILPTAGQNEETDGEWHYKSGGEGCTRNSSTYRSPRRPPQP